MNPFFLVLIDIVSPHGATHSHRIPRSGLSCYLPGQQPPGDLPRRRRPKAIPGETVRLLPGEKRRSFVLQPAVQRSGEMLGYIARRYGEVGLQELDRFLHAVRRAEARLKNDSGFGPRVDQVFTRLDSSMQAKSIYLRFREGSSGRREMIIFCHVLSTIAVPSRGPLSYQ